MALSVLSAGADYMNQRDMAKAQAAQLEKASRLNNAQLANQYEQTNQQAMQEQSQYAIQAMQELGTVSAISAESGLQGVTDQRIKNEVVNNAADNMATIEANRMRTNEQARVRGSAMNAQSRVQAASIARPSALAAGLQIAGAGARLAASYTDTVPAKPKSKGR